VAAEGWTLSNALLLQSTRRESRNFLVEELLGPGPDRVILPIVQSKQRGEEIICDTSAENSQLVGFDEGRTAERLGGLAR
jgi:hypothetical protein